MSCCRCCESSHCDILFHNISKTSTQDEEISSDILAEGLGSSSLSWFEDLTELYMSSENNTKKGDDFPSLHTSDMWSPCPRGGLYPVSASVLGHIGTNSVPKLMSPPGIDPMITLNSPSHRCLGNNQSDIAWSSALATPLDSVSSQWPLNDIDWRDKTGEPVKSGTDSVGKDRLKSKVFNRKLFSPCQSSYREDSLSKALDSTLEGDITLEEESTKQNQGDITVEQESTVQNELDVTISNADVNNLQPNRQELLDERQCVEDKNCWSESKLDDISVIQEVVKKVQYDTTVLTQKDSGAREEDPTALLDREECEMIYNIELEASDSALSHKSVSEELSRVNSLSGTTRDLCINEDSTCDPDHHEMLSERKIMREHKSPSHVEALLTRLFDSPDTTQNWKKNDSVRFVEKDEDVFDNQRQLNDSILYDKDLAETGPNNLTGQETDTTQLMDSEIFSSQKQKSYSSERKMEQNNISCGEETGKHKQEGHKTSDNLVTGKSVRVSTIGLGDVTCVGEESSQNDQNMASKPGTVQSILRDPQTSRTRSDKRVRFSFANLKPALSSSPLCCGSDDLLLPLMETNSHTRGQYNDDADISGNNSHEVGVDEEKLNNESVISDLDFDELGDDNIANIKEFPLESGPVDLHRHKCCEAHEEVLLSSQVEDFLASSICEDSTRPSDYINSDSSRDSSAGNLHMIATDIDYAAFEFDSSFEGSPTFSSQVLVSSQLELNISGKTRTSYTATANSRQGSIFDQKEFKKEIVSQDSMSMTTDVYTVRGVEDVKKTPEKCSLTEESLQTNMEEDESYVAATIYAENLFNASCQRRRNSVAVNIECVGIQECKGCDKLGNSTGSAVCSETTTSGCDKHGDGTDNEVCLEPAIPSCDKRGDGTDNEVCLEPSIPSCDKHRNSSDSAVCLEPTTSACDKHGNSTDNVVCPETTSGCDELIDSTNNGVCAGLMPGPQCMTENLCVPGKGSDSADNRTLHSEIPSHAIPMPVFSSSKSVTASSSKVMPPAPSLRLFSNKPKKFLYPVNNRIESVPSTTTTPLKFTSAVDFNSDTEWGKLNDPLPGVVKEACTSSSFSLQKFEKKCLDVVRLNDERTYSTVDGKASGDSILPTIRVEDELVQGLLEENPNLSNKSQFLDGFSRFSDLVDQGSADECLPSPSYAPVIVPQDLTEGTSAVPLVSHFLDMPLSELTVKENLLKTDSLVSHEWCSPSEKLPVSELGTDAIPPPDNSQLEGLPTSFCGENDSSRLITNLEVNVSPASELSSQLWQATEFSQMLSAPTLEEIDPCTRTKDISQAPLKSLTESCPDVPDRSVHNVFSVGNGQAERESVGGNKFCSTFSTASGMSLSSNVKKPETDSVGEKNFEEQLEHFFQQRKLLGVSSSERKVENSVTTKMRNLDNFVLLLHDNRTLVTESVKVEDTFNRILNRKNLSKSVKMREEESDLTYKGCNSRFSLNHIPGLNKFPSEGEKVLNDKCMEIDKLKAGNFETRKDDHFERKQAERSYQVTDFAKNSGFAGFDTTPTTGLCTVLPSVPVPDIFQGFQTAAGRTISLTVEAQEKAALLLEMEPTDVRSKTIEDDGCGAQHLCRLSDMPKQKTSLMTAPSDSVPVRTFNTDFKPSNVRPGGRDMCNGFKPFKSPMVVRKVMNRYPAIPKDGNDSSNLEAHEENSRIPGIDDQNSDFLNSCVLDKQEMKAYTAADSPLRDGCLTVAHRDSGCTKADGIPRTSTGSYDWEDDTTMTDFVNQVENWDTMGIINEPASLTHNSEVGDSIHTSNQITGHQKFVSGNADCESACSGNKIVKVEEQSQFDQKGLASSKFPEMCLSRMETFAGTRMKEISSKAADLVNSGDRNNSIPEGFLMCSEQISREMPLTLLATANLCEGRNNGCNNPFNNDPSQSDEFVYTKKHPGRSIGVHSVGMSGADEADIGKDRSDLTEEVCKHKDNGVQDIKRFPLNGIATNASGFTNTDDIKSVIHGSPTKHANRAFKELTGSDFKEDVLTILESCNAGDVEWTDGSHGIINDFDTSQGDSKIEFVSKSDILLQDRNVETTENQYGNGHSSLPNMPSPGIISAASRYLEGMPYTEKQVKHVHERRVDERTSETTVLSVPSAQLDVSCTSSERCLQRDGSIHGTNNECTELPMLTGKPIGFCTASGVRVSVSQKALKKVKTLWTRDDGTKYESSVKATDSASIPHGFGQDNLSSVDVPDSSICFRSKTLGLRDVDTSTNLAAVPESCGSMSFTGCSTSISAGAGELWGGDECKAKPDTSESCLSLGFTTAAGARVSVSNRARKLAERFWNEKDAEDSSLKAAGVLRSTVTMSPEPHQELISNHVRDQALQPSSSNGFGFSTAAGAEVSVSDKSLREARKWLEEAEEKVEKHCDSTELRQNSVSKHLQSGSDCDDSRCLSVSVTQASSCQRQKSPKSSVVENGANRQSFQTLSKAKISGTGGERNSNDRNRGFKRNKDGLSKSCTDVLTPLRPECEEYYCDRRKSRGLTLAPITAHSLTNEQGDAPSWLEAGTACESSTFRPPVKKTRMSTVGACSQSEKNPSSSSSSGNRKQSGSSASSFVPPSTCVKAQPTPNEELGSTFTKLCPVFLSKKVHRTDRMADLRVDIMEQSACDLDDEEENKLLCQELKNDTSIHLMETKSVGGAGAVGSGPVVNDVKPLSASQSSPGPEVYEETNELKVPLNDARTQNSKAPMSGEKYLDHEQTTESGYLSETKLMESSLRQGKISQGKKRIQPIDGLWMQRRNAKNLMTFQSSGMQPVWNLSKYELLRLGVSEATTDVTCENAAEFRFNLRRFFPVLKTEILVGDGALLVPDRAGFAGCLEFYRAFLTLDGVDPKLTSEQWVENHYRWIVWKLATTEMNFPQDLASRGLTPNVVMYQLKYRYDREVDHCHRSAIKMILERDDTPCRRMVLRLASVIKQSDGQFQVTVTDGWYSIPAQLDAVLTDHLARKRLWTGRKVITSGAELTGPQTACSPLEVVEGTSLKMSSNSTRPAPWHARLGFCYDPSGLCVPLSSLRPDGGTVACVDVVLARKYPVMYMEKLKEGGCVFRAAEEEDRLRQKYEDQRRARMEKLYLALQADMEKQDVGSSKDSVNFTKKEIAELWSGSELSEAMERTMNLEEFQQSLSESQATRLQEHRRAEMERRQEEVNKKLQEALAEEGNDTRTVVPVQKLKVVGCCRNDIDARTCSVVTVWRPGPDWTEMAEGKRYKLYSLGVTTGRSHCKTSKVSLTTTRQTRFQEKPINENLLDIVYEPRQVLTVSDLREKSTGGVEFDFVGVVLRHITTDCSKRRFSPGILYVSDYQQGILRIKLWSPSQAQSTFFKDNQIIMASNLCLSHAALHSKMVTADARSEFVSFSKSGVSSRYSDIFQQLEKLRKAPDFFPTMHAELDGLLEMGEATPRRGSFCGTMSSTELCNDFPAEIMEELFSPMNHTETTLGCAKSGEKNGTGPIAVETIPQPLSSDTTSSCSVTNVKVLKAGVKRCIPEVPTGTGLSREWNGLPQMTSDDGTGPSTTGASETGLLKRRKLMLREKMSKLLAYSSPAPLAVLPHAVSPSASQDFRSPITKKI